MEKAGKGVAIAGFGPLVERLEMNMTNPSSSLDADTRSNAKGATSFSIRYKREKSFIDGY